MKKAGLLFFVLVVVCGMDLFGQEQKTDSTQTTPALVAISVTKISQRGTEMNERLKIIREGLADTSKVNTLERDFQLVKDTVKGYIAQFDDSTRYNDKLGAVENAATFYEVNKKKLEKVKSQLSERSELLNTYKSELTESASIWQITKDSIEQDVAVALVNRVDTTLLQISILKDTIVLRQNQVLTMLDDISSLDLLVANEIETIEKIKKNIEGKYFTKDSPALWEYELIQRDSTGFGSQLSNAFLNNWKSSYTYFTFNYNLLFNHIAVILVLYLLLLYLKKYVEEAKRYRALLSGFNVRIFFKHKLSSSVLLSILGFNVLYAESPGSLKSVLMIVLIVPLFVLFRAVSFQNSRKILVLFFLFIVTNFIIEHLNPLFLDTRILLLVVGVVVGLSGFWMGTMIKVYKGKTGLLWLSLLRFAVFVLTIGGSVSVALNVLGVVKLSVLLLSASIGSVGLIVLVLAILKILEAFLILITYVKPFSAIAYIKTNRRGMLVFIHKLLNVCIFLFIVRALLSEFGVSELVAEWLMGILNENWEFGSVNISLLSLFTFFFTVIFSYYIGRILRYLLEDELFARLRIKPSIANSIAITVYYVIISLGFFLAVFSIGVNWDDVNLIISALGVGIGFGLQNIIMNFISGLIITYEKPLKVGDTIEVGTLIGDVQEIGIRSSKVKTYSGAEVVVPNGDLISKELINWTLSDKLKRQELRFKTAFSADPKKVIEIMRTVALAHNNTLQEPKPLGLFEGFGDSALEFRLLFWTPFGVGMSTKSDVAIAIYGALQENGIEIPIPKQEIHLQQNKES